MINRDELFLWFEKNVGINARKDTFVYQQATSFDRRKLVTKQKDLRQF